MGRTQLFNMLLLSLRVFAVRSSPLRRRSGVGAHLGVGVSSHPTQLTQPAASLAASCVGHSGSNYVAECTVVFVAQPRTHREHALFRVIGVSYELCAIGGAARVTRGPSRPREEVYV